MDTPAGRTPYKGSSVHWTEEKIRVVEEDLRGLAMIIECLMEKLKLNKKEILAEAAARHLKGKK